MSDILPVNIEECLIVGIFKKLPLKEVITKRQIGSKLREDHNTYVNESKIRKYITEIKKTNKEVMIISCDSGYYVTDDPSDKVEEMRDLIAIHEAIIKDALESISYYKNLL